MNTAWILAAGAIATALLAITAVAALVHRAVRPVRDFLEDWAGEAARPGIAARQGVMSRLQVMEDRLQRVEREVRPNGGKSIKDQVARIERALDAGPDG